MRLAGCRLPSGVALVELSDAIELTDDNDESTSDTGATPNDDSISSKSLFFFKLMNEINKHFIIYFIQQNQQCVIKISNLNKPS